MDNRTLYLLTALVLIAMAVLLGLNLTQILQGTPATQNYLNPNEVRGVAVVHDNKNYTLNFQQQVDLIDKLNRSVKISDIPTEGTKQKPDFDKIVIYQFNNKPDISVTPVTYIDSNLIFKQPEWNKEGYLMDTSAGLLQQTITNSYDH